MTRCSFILLNDEDQSVKIFMRLALLQAETALEKGQFPVGSVIIYRGKPIAFGHNLVDALCNDLAHAELQAISSCKEFLFENKGHCEIYSTLEPCFMCFGAIAHFRFSKLVGASEFLCLRVF